MPAGALRERLTLQKRSGGRDIAGGKKVEWEYIANVWGSAEYLSGREFIASRAGAAEISARFRIREREDFTPNDRVLWKGKAFNISEVIPVHESNRYLELLGSADAGK